MSEFSNVGKHCAFEACNKLDFLPFLCSACTLYYCKDHSTFKSHNCPDAEQYLRANPIKELWDVDSSSESTEAASQSLTLVNETPAQILNGIVHRFDHFESYNETKDHIKVKGYLKEDKEQKKGDLSSDIFFENARGISEASCSSEQEKRISLQVQKMKIKSKSSGPQGIEMENRFFLNVKIRHAQEGFWERYMYFPRVWTLGRCVDYIKSLVPHIFDELLSSFAANSVDVFCETSKTTLPLDAVLNDLNGQSRLQSFDVVQIGPRGSFTVLQSDFLDIKSSECTLLNEISESNQDAIATQTVLEPVEKSEALAQAEEKQETQPKGSLSVTITVGKNRHIITGIEPAIEKVIDLKRRIEQITLISPQRQKLVYKGVLDDSKLIKDTALKEGSRIIVLSK